MAKFNEAKFRSDAKAAGYSDEEILKQRNIKKIKRMISALEKMKLLGDWGPNPELWLNKLKETAE